MTLNDKLGALRKDESEQRLVPLTVTRQELLVDGKDDEFRNLVHAALAFSARLNAIRDGYAEFVGLPGPQYTVLVSILHLQQEGDVGVKKLADHLSLSGTFITTETRKLEEARYVTKIKNTSDKRRVSLKVTSRGEDLLHRLSEVQQQVNNVHFGTLSDEEFDVLRKVMPELVVSSDAGLSLLRHLSKLSNLSQIDD